MLVLIRHAEIPKEIENPSITEKGVKQARKLAEHLSKQEIDKAYVSTLERAGQTWQEYNRIKPLTLTEHTDKAREIYRVIVGGPEKTGTPASREKEDRKRVDEFYKKLVKESKERTILVFTHGNLINYFIAKTRKTNPKKRWVVTINYCSITIIKDKKILLENSMEYL